MKTTTKRIADFLKQTGKGHLTPKQRRRVEQKDWKAPLEEDAQ